MKKLTVEERKRGALLGALVGDAASLGLHWIYTQPRIRKIAPERPEFQEPRAENYDGVPGYFAHKGKAPGDNTMYGEYLLLLLRSMAAKKGEFHLGDYLSRFRSYFGPGGAYVGYADGPMRGTLFNADLVTREIEQNILAMKLPVSEERQNQFARYISKYFFEGNAEELKEMLRGPFDLYETTEEEYAVLDRVVEEVQTYRKPLGPDDAQMPALTKVPVITVRYAGAPELYPILEEAVRANNNNDLAVAYAKGVATALERILTAEADEKLGNPGPEGGFDQEALLRLLTDAFAELPEPRLQELEKALGMLSQDPKAVTLKFGPACDCAMGVPVALHNLLTAGSFQEALRVNIWSCGDSAGRAMVLGTLAGALYGVGGSKGIPEEWIQRTKAAAEAEELLSKILGEGA